MLYLGMFHFFFFIFYIMEENGRDESIKERTATKE